MSKSMQRWMRASGMLVAMLAVQMGVWGQMFPQRSLGMLNPFQDHPAAAGTRECLDLHVGFRRQWSGIEGAPTNAYANLHGAWSASQDAFHGVGGRVETDEAGAWQSTSLGFAYAYNLPLNRSSRLAAGLSAGFYQQRLNWGLLDLPEVGAGQDPGVLGSAQTVFPLLDLGLWYQNRRVFAGLTWGNVTQPALDQIGTQSTLHRRWVMLGGTRVPLEGKWDFMPTATVRAAQGLRPSFDAVAMLDYDGKVSMGAGYRTGGALVVLFQVDIADYISLAYAYDANFSALRPGAPGGHELVLGINACDARSKGGLPCPAYN